MKLKIRLSLLDNLQSFGYEKAVPVYFGNNYVGQCEVLRDAGGNHYGILEHNEPLNTDLYLYYTNWVATKMGFWFSGIQLTNKLLPETSTPQLKDVIF